MKTNIFLVALSLATMRLIYTVTNHEGNVTSMQWQHLSSLATKEMPSVRKLMLTVFCNSQGPILEHHRDVEPQ
jgi:hypothetical protein